MTDLKPEFQSVPDSSVSLESLYQDVTAAESSTRARTAETATSERGRLEFQKLMNDTNGRRLIAAYTQRLAAEEKARLKKEATLKAKMAEIAKETAAKMVQATAESAVGAAGAAKETVLDWWNG